MRPLLTSARPVERHGISQNVVTQIAKINLIRALAQSNDTPGICRLARKIDLFFLDKNLDCPKS